MDTIRMPSLSLATPAFALRAVATAALTQAFDWLTQSRSRATLAELDDRLLADIGLSRADVARECDKPFWR